MLKKIALKYIKEQFKKEDYKLLTTEYKNNQQKLEYICPNGHKYNISWTNWQQKHRCPFCAIEKHRLNIRFIKSKFEKEGYKLLTKEYINSKQKLFYKCPKGHKHSISWDEWSHLGNRCPYCASNARLTIKFIRSEFKKENYKLLTKKYINAHQKLDYICPKGHRCSVSWSNWKCNKCRCPYCAGQEKPTIEFIRDEFAKKDYTLLTKEYINNKQKLEYVCPKGHKGNICWGNWQRGKECLICRFINCSVRMTGSGNLQWKGGVSFEPYSPEFNNKLKELIFERDDRQCQNPDCWGTSKRLCPHHIDYNKKNCDLSNLITLCVSCNSRANADRDYWTKFYQEIMNKKYGYVYGK